MFLLKIVKWTDTLKKIREFFKMFRAEFPVKSTTSSLTGTLFTFYLSDFKKAMAVSLTAVVKHKQKIGYYFYFIECNLAW